MPEFPTARSGVEGQMSSEVAHCVSEIERRTFKEKKLKPAFKLKITQGIPYSLFVLKDCRNQCVCWRCIQCRWWRHALHPRSGLSWEGERLPLLQPHFRPLQTQVPETWANQRARRSLSTNQTTTRWHDGLHWKPTTAEVLWCEGLSRPDRRNKTVEPQLTDDRFRERIAYKENCDVNAVDGRPLVVVDDTNGDSCGWTAYRNQTIGCSAEEHETCIKTSGTVLINNMTWRS